MSDGVTNCDPYPPLLADSSPRPFDPAWRTETVLALAKGIEADRAFDRLPILADALEEAGCDDEVLLRHCRECERHEAWCWVMNSVLDRRSGEYPDNPEPRLTLEQIAALQEVRRASEELRRINRYGSGTWITYVAYGLCAVVFLAAMYELLVKPKPAPVTRPAVVTPPTVNLLQEQVNRDLERIQALAKEVDALAGKKPVDPIALRAKRREFWDAIDRVRGIARMAGETLPPRPTDIDAETPSIPPRKSKGD